MAFSFTQTSITARIVVVAVSNRDLDNGRCSFTVVLVSCRKGAGADLTKIQPAGIRTKSGGARSIEGGKGPAGSGLSLGVAGVENGGRKDATFLRPPW